MLALGVASAAIYALAAGDVLTVNGQSQGILFILAVGAATDYSLLVVARFREELRDHESKYDAMRAAYKGAFEPIVASGLTVILGLLCLLLSDLASLSGLGPVGRDGHRRRRCSARSPCCPPRWCCWAGGRSGRSARCTAPSTPTPRGCGAGWRGWCRPAYRVVWVGTFLALAASAAFITQLDEDQVPQTELFLTEVESVTAQDVIDAHYEADNASPAQVVTPEEDLDATLELLTGHPGIAQPATAAPGQPSQPAVFPLPSEEDPRQPKIVDGQAIVFATLADPADSQAATDTVRDAAYGPRRGVRGRAGRRLHRDQPRHPRRDRERPRQGDPGDPAR